MFNGDRVSTGDHNKVPEMDSGDSWETLKNVLNATVYTLPQFFFKKRFDENATECSVQFSSVAQSCPTLQPHESQHARPPCTSPTPGVYSNSCPSSR